MKIAVCDDSKIDLMLSAMLIKNYFKIKSRSCCIETYDSGDSIISDIKNGEWYDIIFMDIYIGNELGINVAKKLRELGYGNILIFSTVTDEYAVEGYSVKASGYLIKPYSQSGISAVLDGILENYVDEALEVRSRNTVRYIPFTDISYIESCNNRCIVHTNKEEITVYKKLDEIQISLKDSSFRFLRCHRSYIVNMDHIVAAKDNFLLDNGDIVLIKAKNSAAIKKEYMDYIKAKR